MMVHAANSMTYECILLYIQICTIVRISCRKSQAQISNTDYVFITQKNMYGDDHQLWFPCSLISRSPTPTSNKIKQPGNLGQSECFSNTVGSHLFKSVRTRDNWSRTEGAIIMLAHVTELYTSTELLMCCCHWCAIHLLTMDLKVNFWTLHMY